MKRSTKKSLYKIFVSLFVLFYTFLPQSIVIGQVIDEVSQENAAPIETQEDIPQENAAPTVVDEISEGNLPDEEKVNNEVPEESTIPQEVVPIDEASKIIKEAMNFPVWEIHGNSATTFDVVQLGKTYISPQNSRVRVTFTKLPENPSKLTITEIVLTQEEIDATNAVSNIAYDITTDMIDGTFEYDLTLPNVKENTKIVYVEERKDLLTGVSEITNEIVDNGDTMKIKDLEHFTIFIVTYHDSGHTIEQTQYHRGENVVAYASGLPNDYYRIDVINPSNDSVAHSSTCDSRRTLVSYTYTIKSTDAIGTGWKVVLSRFSTTANCNDNTGAIDTATDYFEVTPTSIPTSLSNPILSNSCGLDIALVIDNSNSIDSSELTLMKNALKGFVDALAGTPTQFSVTKFGTNATVIQGFTSDTTLVKNAINSVTTGGGGTNWENAFNKARAAFDPRTDKPNLIIFASDGNPTYPNCGGSSTCAKDVNAAIIEANHAKEIPARVLAIGIGDELKVDNLKAISGNVVNGSDLLTTDVITTDFSTMAGQLADFASQTCGGTISVNKYLEDENTTGGAGWVFTLSGTSGATLTTDSNGQANSGKISTGTYSIAETLVSGYSFLSAECKDQDGAIVGTSATNGLSGITIDDSDIITCDFINTAVCVAGQHSLEGKVKGGSYTTGNLCSGSGDCWSEGENVLARLTIDGLLAGRQYSVVLEHDYKDSNGVIGYENFNNFSATGASGLSVSLPVYTSSDSTAQYTVSFTATSSTVVLDWNALLSDEAGQWNGASLHYRLVTGACGGVGNKDIPINPGQIVVLGSFTPIKSTENGADPLDWTFNLSGLTSVNGIKSGETTTGLALDTNNGDAIYTITEAGLSEWELVSVSSPCVINGSTINVTLTKDNPDVSCTFVNKLKTGTIIVDKVTDPSGDSQSFSFTTSGTGYSGFSLTDSSTPNSQTLVPGTYSVSEDSVSGWTNTSADCVSSIGDTETISNLELDNGETITCTFTNTRDTGTIELKKVWSGTPGQTNLNIGTTVGGSEIVTVQTGTSGGTPLTTGQQTVPTGTYYLSESGGLDSYTKSPLSCFNDTDNNGSKDENESMVSVDSNDSVSVATGNHIVCSYTNTRQQGTIIVKKVMVGGTDTFTFTGTPSGTISTNEGTLSVTVDTGSYTTIESDLTGWKLTNISCDDGNSTSPSIGDLANKKATFNVENGETITCIFTNSKLSINVIKTANPTSIPETGGDVEFTVKVENPSAVSVELTSLLDNKFGDITNITGSTCSVPQAIASNESYECKFTKKLLGNAGTEHENTVTAIASGVSDTDSETVTFEDVAPAIDVTKTVDDSSIPETGQEVTFAYRITNTGVEDVTVTSILDDKFGDLLATAVAQNGGANIVILSTDPDSYFEFTYKTTLSSDSLTSHTNRVDVIAVDDEKTSATDFDTETVTFEDVKPDISVTKTASATSVPETGGNVTFTFTVKNTSSEESVTITSLSDSVYATLSGDDDCKVGTVLASGASCEFSITKWVEGDYTGPDHVNVFTGKAVDNDGTEATDTDDATVDFSNVFPTIEVTKTAGTHVLSVPGGDVLFTVVVTNNSQESVTLTTLTDDIYGNLNGRDTCATGGTIPANGGIYTCTFTGAVNGNPGFYTDVVTAIATDNDGTTDTDTDDATVELEGGKIIVEKLTTIPDPSHQLFEFKPSWGNNFSLINDQSIDSGWLAPGSYSVEELTTSGWELTSTNCISSIGDTEIPGSLELDANETITCTFTNTRDTGSLTVYKVIDEDGDLATTDDQTIGIDWEFDVDGAEGDTSNPSPLLTDTEGKRIFPDLKTGNYNVIETYVAGFEIVGATCGIENGSLDGNIMYSVEVSKNINTICTFYNTPNGVVQGYKWNDINKDGIKDSDEPLLPGWTINLYKSNEIGFGETPIDSTQTGNTEDNFGMYSFDHLLPATYKVCEEQKDGWNQSYPINDKNNCYIVTLPSESEPLSLVLDVDEYYFGNYVIPPQLRITKDNNSPVEGLLTGSTVLYTIIVTAPSDEDEKGTYLINNIKVTDILPKGFEYMPGTWTANSSVRGNIKGSITTEPEYNEGLATWILGDMKEGEIVTLTYTAKINLLNEPGLYKDIAFVQGDSLLAEKDSGDVLGISYDLSEYLHTDTLGDNFVGTKVLVIEPMEEGGEVLGASTTLTLPKTGAETYITLGAIISMILGILLFVFGKKRKLNTILLSTVLLLGILTLVKPIQIYAQVPNAKVSVRLEQPKTGITDREFNITYVALSIPVKPITVQCQYSLDGVNFSNFDISKTTNSGDCKVDQSIVTGSGTYYFRAIASTTDGGAESEVITVKVADKPSPVTEYSKAKAVCTYTLKFKSSTSKVQIFRSDNQKSFYADDTTLITKPYLTVTPNALSTYTDTPADCSKEYYYAVRAVDEYSNVSALVTDNVVTVVEQTQTSTSQESEEVAGEETTTQQEQETTSTGEVAGEETTAQQEEKAETDTKDETKIEEKETEESIWDKYKYLIISVIVVVLGSGIYNYIRRKK